MMTYREFSPRPELAPFVAATWCWDEPVAASQANRILPDGCIELVVNFGSPQEKRSADGTTTKQPRAFVAGQLTRHIDLIRTDRVEAFGVRFRTAAFSSFTRVPLDEFTDRDVELCDVWSPELEHRMWDAESVAARKHVLESFLLTRLSASANLDRMVSEAIARIDNGDTPDIGALAGSLGISIRQLQRRFRAATGLTPKEYSTIRRLQQVVRRLKLNARQGLTALAHDLGFYDHAHFIHQLRQMAGLSPSQLRRTLQGDCMSPFYNLSRLSSVHSAGARRPER